MKGTDGVSQKRTLNLVATFTHQGRPELSESGQEAVTRLFACCEATVRAATNWQFESRPDGAPGIGGEGVKRVSFYPNGRRLGSGILVAFVNDRSKIFQVRTDVPEGAVGGELEGHLTRAINQIEIEAKEEEARTPPQPPPPASSRILHSPAPSTTPASPPPPPSPPPSSPASKPLPSSPAPAQPARKGLTFYDLKNPASDGFKRLVEELGRSARSDGTIKIAGIVTAVEELTGTKAFDGRTVRGVCDTLIRDGVLESVRPGMYHLLRQLPQPDGENSSGVAGSRSQPAEENNPDRALRAMERDFALLLRLLKEADGLLADLRKRAAAFSENIARARG